MDEKDFKKLASNSRDWLIYELLSEKSKETIHYEITAKNDLPEAIYTNEVVSEHVSGTNIEKCEHELEIKGEFEICAICGYISPKRIKPQRETSVEETVCGTIQLVTDKAVLIGDGERVAWFPKSVIMNLDQIVLEQNTYVEFKVVEWFKYKIEWKAKE